jgi:hypothetical protein
LTLNLDSQLCLFCFREVGPNVISASDGFGSTDDHPEGATTEATSPASQVFSAFSFLQSRVQQGVELGDSLEKCRLITPVIQRRG